VEETDIEGIVRASAAGRRLNERQPLTDDVHDVLVDMLMKHALAPGARLSIEALARTMGVSPTPVREALARIEATGLVLKSPHRGYMVSPLLTFDELRSLIELRLLVEPAAAAAAARLSSAEDAADLQACALSGGVGDDNDPAVNRLDMIYDATFHDRVAELAGNPWLRQALARLQSHLHMYRLYYHAHHAAATSTEHAAIAAAIADRDPDAAEQAMRAHLETALRRSGEVFASGALPST
jgi:DNA-binding GntR family transcriptional regulator